MDNSTAENFYEMVRFLLWRPSLQLLMRALIIGSIPKSKSGMLLSMILSEIYLMG